jgi:hypothetical protein
MARTVDERLPLHLSFEAACRSLRQDARGIVGPTEGELRLELGGSAVARGVVVRVGILDVDEDEACIDVSWRAASHPHLFPVFEGRLQVLREGWADVELRLVGSYRAPFWFAGELGDRMLGHRVALRTLRSYLEGVGQRFLHSSARRARTGHHGSPWWAAEPGASTTTSGHAEVP